MRNFALPFPNMRLIVVALFQSLPEAQRARVALDEQDIPAHLPDDEAVSVNPFAPLGMRAGRVALSVPDELVPHAREALRAAGHDAAVRRALSADEPGRPPLWPRLFRFAGLLIVGLAVVLLLTRGDPAGYWLVGIGILIWAAGITGLLLRGKEPAAPR